MGIKLTSIAVGLLVSREFAIFTRFALIGNHLLYILFILNYWSALIRVISLGTVDLGGVWQLPWMVGPLSFPWVGFWAPNIPYCALCTFCYIIFTLLSL